MTLPAFTKLGTKFSQPAWMASASVQPFFPNIVQVTAGIAALTGETEGTFLIFYSSDHAASTGYIGMARAATIEGAWTDSGAAIHSGADQRETPCVVYDPDNNRLNIYVHDNVSSVTNGSQGTRLLTTTDLTSFTDQGQVLLYGQHTGYATVHRRGSGDWRAMAYCTGDESNFFGVWTSTDGASWTFSHIIHPGAMHLLGYGDGLGGVPHPFVHDGQWYLMATKRGRGWGAIGTATHSALVAIPMDAEWTAFTGPAQTVLAPGTTGADDVSLYTTYQAIDVGGTLYVVYCAKDGGGNNHFLLAKEDSGASPEITPYWPVRSDGELVRHTDTAVSESWDATASDLPAWLSVAAGSGANNSGWSAGNYYELKTGSAASFDNVYMETVGAFDPSEIETIEISFDGVLIVPNVKFYARIEWTDGTNRATISWNDQDSTEDVRWGVANLWPGGVKGVNYPMYAIGYGSARHAWHLSNARTWTLRLHDYGRRVTLLVDGMVAYEQSIDSVITWGTSVRPRLTINTRTTSGNAWLRLTGVTLKAYTIAAPTGLAATPGDGQVGLTWSDPKGSQLASANIYRGTTSGSLSLLDTVAAGTEAYTDATASNGTEYFYAVSMVDDNAVESARTAEVSATPASSGTVTEPGAAAWPDEADVRAGVTYGPNGSDYTGTYAPDLWSSVAEDPGADEIEAIVALISNLPAIQALDPAPVVAGWNWTYADLPVIYINLTGGPERDGGVPMRMLEAVIRCYGSNDVEARATYRALRTMDGLRRVTAGQRRFVQVRQTGQIATAREAVPGSNLGIDTILSNWRFELLD